MSIRIIPSHPGHLRIIAANMRQRDIEEVRAGWDAEPIDAMKTAVDGSYYVRTMMWGLAPLCIYGLAPLSVLGNTARGWIFASQAVDAYPFAFARASKLALREIFVHCRLVTNLIDVDDTAAVKWIEWLGATRVEPYQERGGKTFVQMILVDRTPRELMECQQV